MRPLQSLAFGHLRSQRSSKITNTYKYDPFGRRIEKNVNGTITKYLYDNEDILLEYDATNTVMARYTHGPGIIMGFVEGTFCSIVIK